MNKDELKTISGTIISGDVTLSFTEICSATKVNPQLVLELIEYHIIQPQGNAESNWAFDHICLKRVRLARNFYHDLEVNLPGIALAIDMLERIDALEAEIAKLK